MKTHQGYSSIKTHWESKDRKKWTVDTLVKGRNEPCKIVQVAEIVAKSRNQDIDVVIAAAYQNSVDVFGGRERLKKFGGIREN